MKLNSQMLEEVYTLAVKATNKFEETRDIVKTYINAKQQRNNFY